MKQLCRIKRPCTGADQDVLAQNITRPVALGVAIQIVIPCGGKGRNTFDHLEPICRHQERLGRRVVTVIGPTDPLDQPLHVLGCADLNDEIDVAPIDTQIEAPRADHRPQIPAHHRRLNRIALIPREAPVVNANRQIVRIGEPEVVKEYLCLRPRVVENQRGFVAFDLFQHGWDCIARAPSSPRRRGVCDQHPNVRCRSWVRIEDRAASGGQFPCEGRRVLNGRRQTHAPQVRAHRL